MSQNKFRPYDKTVDVISFSLKSIGKNNHILASSKTPVLKNETDLPCACTYPLLPSHSFCLFSHFSVSLKQVTVNLYTVVLFPLPYHGHLSHLEPLVFLVTPGDLCRGACTAMSFVDVVGLFLVFTTTEKWSLYMCLHVDVFVKDQFLESKIPGLKTKHFKITVDC